MGGKTILTIDSEIRPKGLKGNLAQMMLGGMLERMMVNEWNSASEALMSEATATSSSRKA